MPAPAAALGTKVSVPTLNGDEKIDVPAGTQPGTVGDAARPRDAEPSAAGGGATSRSSLNVAVPRNLTPSPARAAGPS